MENNNNIQQQLYQQQNSNKRYFSLIIVLLAVIGLSVGYAAYSASLQIQGISRIDDDFTWNITMGEDIDDIVTCPTGDDCQLIEDPTNPSTDPSTTDPEDGTVFWLENGVLNFKHFFKAPGEEYSFEVNFANNGSIDARIGSYVLPDNFSTNDVSNMLTYSLYLKTGNDSYTNITGILDGEGALVNPSIGKLPGKVGDTVSSHTFKVVVKLKDLDNTAAGYETLLPKYSAAISAINSANNGEGAKGVFTVNYIQDN
ncbi:MAG: hypothetical protein IKF71_01300 [Bacilli bacterium]|nr:hypothetical protein [Bacilli bacterium]